MVYAVSELFIDGKRYLSAASEERGQHANLIDPETMEYCDFWKGETGVMNIIQVPGRNMALTITGFYPVFQSKEAEICALEPTEKGVLAPWKKKAVLHLPFCHRIGIIKNKNGVFVLGSQLCHDKDFQEDWSQPGDIFLAKIPDSIDGEWKLHKLFGGLTKNHGLFIDHDNKVYICSENGVLYFDLSDYSEGEQLRPLLISTTPSSDMYLTEMQGKKYAAVIEPFHGNRIAVYEMGAESSTLLHSYQVDFGHVVWIGMLFHRLAVIAGSRGGRKQLEIIWPDNGERCILDENVGPTQITVYEEGEKVKILSANHGSGEITLYSLTED